MSSTTQHSKEPHDAASSHRATPGPWTCRESALSQNGNLWFIDADISPAHQVRVAETWNESHARLIASAPDLLRLVKGAWHLCESLLAVREGASDESIRSMSEALANAIEQAEGVS